MQPIENNAVLDKLVLEYPELEALVAEHKAYKTQLDDMNHRPYLSPEDDLERKRLQKVKLAVKDKIHRFLEEHAG